jgi:hypothetical protein
VFLVVLAVPVVAGVCGGAVLAVRGLLRFVVCVEGSALSSFAIVFLFLFSFFFRRQVSPRVLRWWYWGSLLSRFLVHF